MIEWKHVLTWISSGSGTGSRSVHTVNGQPFVLQMSSTINVYQISLKESEFWYSLFFCFHLVSAACIGAQTKFRWCTAGLIRRYAPNRIFSIGSNPRPLVKGRAVPPLHATTWNVILCHTCTQTWRTMLHGLSNIVVAPVSDLLKAIFDTVT